MESLQLACLLSCKACPISPKQGPSLGFRPLRQVGFSSLGRNQTEYGCLMGRSSANMGGGGSGGVGFNLFPPGMSTGNGEIGEAEAEVSESKQENVGDNQLKEIRVELCKNNEEIKKLRETVQNSYWNLLRIAVLDQKNYKESIRNVAHYLIERQKEEQQHKIEMVKEEEEEQKEEQQHKIEMVKEEEEEDYQDFTGALSNQEW